MQILRGTTPKIVINVKSDIDLSSVVQAWVYIAQQNKVKVDKEIQDVVIEQTEQKKTITVTLSQDDTLALKAGDGLFQIRLLQDNGTALGTVATKITVLEVYKGGVIQ